MGQRCVSSFEYIIFFRKALKKSFSIFREDNFSRRSPLFVDNALITIGNDIWKREQENYIWNFVGINVTNYYFHEIAFTNAILAKRYDCRGKLIRNLISTIVNDNDTDAGLKNHEDWTKRGFHVWKEWLGNRNHEYLWFEIYEY